MIKLDKNNLIAVQTSMSIEKIYGKTAVRVTKSPEVIKDDKATYVRINDIKDFKDGIIEV